MIESLIRSAVIVESLAGGTKNEVLSEMVDRAVAAGSIPDGAKSGVMRKLRERESKGSTGIGNGIAVPHVKSDKIASIALVLARSLEGIEFEAIDGAAVHTIFMILGPKDQADVHLQALRWISGLARNSDFRKFVLAAPGEGAIRDLLREMSAPA